MNTEFSLNRAMEDGGSCIGVSAGGLESNARIICTNAKGSYPIVALSESNVNGDPRESVFKLSEKGVSSCLSVRLKNLPNSKDMYIVMYTNKSIEECMLLTGLSSDKKSFEAHIKDLRDNGYTILGTKKVTITEGDTYE